MSIVFRRCIKANSSLFLLGNATAPLPQSCINRSFSDEKSLNETQFSSSSIMIENGLNVHELPLVVRRLKHISEVDESQAVESPKTTTDSPNYNMIQEEFKQCMDLKDVFSLLNKCTKITPNIALGAMERIYDLEKNPTLISLPNKSMHVTLAKGAILDKLIRVVMKTEDTQTILNILNTVSSFMELYKPKFSDEILLRVVDNKLSIVQLCTFMEFLIKNKSDPIYSETIDKLWVGFFEREKDIDEHNIGKVFQVLHGMKSSKKTILGLLEHKFSDIWFKINVAVMLDILETFVHEKYISTQSFAVVGTWLYANIHAIDQDSLLDVVSKLTRLNYTDHQVEKAITKYMKLKGSKIDSHVLVVGILNYCLHFKIRNELILNVCSKYFVMHSHEVPNIFLKSIIYPFGYLNFDPKESHEFWTTVEGILDKDFGKFSTDDMCSILLSFIYVEKYPLKLVNRLFSSENLVKVNNPETIMKLHLVDTALSLQCSDYHGPFLPKDQWTKDVPQDPRIKNIFKKTMDIFTVVAGGPQKLSSGVMVPHIYSHDTYLIDVLIHPTELVTSNWKSKSARNENIAILIHLPDHYCAGYEQLVGHQEMRKRHLKILGMKVVSLKYSTLSNYYTSCNTSGLRQYLEDSLKNAEECTNM